MLIFAFDMAKISILMATTDLKILENKNFLSLNFDENHQALVVNQKINSDENLVIDHPYIQVINSEQKGISNSRNLALSVCDADWVHFCDDDLGFVPDYFQTIENALLNFPSTDFFRFEITTPEGQKYKNYQSSALRFQANTWRNRQRILSISSVEVVGRVSFIKDHNMEFREDFGVGSAGLPMGEEAMFLMDGLEAGAGFEYVPEALVIHPIESSGKKLGKAELRVLGVLFRRTFGVGARGFIVYYALKKRRQLEQENINISQAIYWMNEKK